MENHSCAVNCIEERKEKKRKKTLYVLFLPIQVTSVPGLRREGVREIRARYPNFDPEIGSVIDGQIHVHDGTRRNYRHLTSGGCLAATGGSVRVHTTAIIAICLNLCLAY